MKQLEGVRSSCCSSSSSESSSGSRSSGPVVAVVVLAMSVENAQLEGVKSQEAPQAVRGGASRSPFAKILHK